MEKANQKIALAMAVLILGSQPVFAESLKDQKDQAEGKKSEVDASIDTIQSQISGAKAEAGNVQAEINRLDGQITSASNELNLVNNEIYNLQLEIEETKAELKAAQDKLEVKKKLFSKRLRMMYMTSNTGYLDILLSADNVENLLGNAKMISHIAKQDKSLLEEIKEQINIIETKKQELETQEADLEAKRASVAAKKASLEKANAKKQTYMASLESNIAAYEAEYNAMLESSVALENKINSLDSEIKEEEAAAAQLALEKQKAEAAAAAAKAETANAPTQSSQSTPTETVVNVPNEPIRKEKSGSNYWPLPGYRRISSPYGYRYHPILKVNKLHTGIDIPAPSGTPIVASKDGTVIASSFMRGYGNCVMIDHGDMVTVYAHCSSRIVNSGQSVQAGQTIAYVGSTGMSTGPHLHFEVRVGGSTTNPLNYV